MSTGSRSRVWVACGVFLVAALAGAAAGASPEASPPQPTNLAVLHRSGQTFVTWAERADQTGEQYRVYRHTQAITAANLAQAALLLRVPEDSSRFYAGRYSNSEGAWEARYTDRFVIADRASPLGAGTGLLVWTLAPADFGGASSGPGYYAVTTVQGAAENRTDFTPANSAGAVAESVEDPLPVEVATSRVGAGGRVFIQYMDLRNYNRTFHAPRAANGFYGLDGGSPAVANAVQYAHDYVVFDPDSCESPPPARFPVNVSLHGWGGNTYGPLASDPDPWYCAYKIYPVDESETWYLGFARNHDYRQPGDPAAPDTVVNFTEYRVLRMVWDLLRHPAIGPETDPNRVYVYGHSMGGSGTLALALRFPNVFAAAYASEPMTNYSTSGDGGGLDWRPDLTPKWGAVAADLPMEILAPNHWADHLAGHQGTGVWTWQDHQAMVQARIAEDTVPLGFGHGRNDTVIEWPTQGQPAYAPFNQARRCWGGAVTAADHSWLSFQGLPPAIGTDGSLTPFLGLRVLRNETVPGLSNLSADSPIPPAGDGGYNRTIDWSASWNPWDGAPVDTAGEWRMSLRTTDATSQTVDVTPRRLQAFRVVPGATTVWENRRVADGVLVASGAVVAGANGIATVPGVAVSPAGNRLSLAPRGQDPADWNADGAEDLGVFRNGMWFLAYSPDHAGVDQTTAFGSPVPGRDAPEIGEFGCAGGEGPDGRRDLAILRKAFSTWMATLSPDWGSAPDLIRTFGTTNHKRIATRRLDTNADGCSDIGVFRNGCFDILESPAYGPAARHVCFGPGTDEPLAADLDRDGRSDLILWRSGSSHYTYRLSSESYVSDHAVDLGAGSVPLLGDLNGDAMADLGSYRPAFSTFRVSFSPDFSVVGLVKIHGASGDIPLLADVNGDGVEDIGIFRNTIARWWFLCSPGWTATCVSQSFGQSGDTPIYGKPTGMP